MMTFDLTINGVVHKVDVEAEMPLLWVLRDELGLMGTKFGCGIAECGACTVHVDGVPVRSCSFPVEAAQGATITTIEGLAPEGASGEAILSAIQAAWIEHQVPQCGYCQSGMIMAVSVLLNASPNPSDAEIDEAITNICRCGSYPRVRRAIRSLALIEDPLPIGGGEE